MKSLLCLAFGFWCGLHYTAINLSNNLGKPPAPQPEEEEIEPTVKNHHRFISYGD